MVVFVLLSKLFRRGRFGACRGYLVQDEADIGRPIDVRTDMISGKKRWISRRYRSESATSRLYCVPYAGGSSVIFSSWSALLGPAVEICPLVLPGREERFSEPAATVMAELVAELADALTEEPDLPFAIFGHSMGGLVAFELARQLEQLAAPMPTQLFLSACAPVRAPERTRRHGLSDPDLIEELRLMNGTPAEFFDEPDLMELLLPTIRADFQLAEAYTAPAGSRIGVPITAFAGEDDASVKPAEVAGWQAHTTKDFTLHRLSGDHFFIHDVAPVLAVVAGALQRQSTIT